MIPKKSLDFFLVKYKGKFYLHGPREDYGINEITARIYDLCDGKRSISNISEIISKKFSYNYDLVRKDVIEIIKKMSNLEILSLDERNINE